MNDSGRSLRRRTFLALAAGASTAGVGLVIGRSRRTGIMTIDDRGGVVHRVTGPSMAPALWGPHAHLDCPECSVNWPVHCQPHLRPREAVICWNCGGSVPIDDVRIRPGDLVRVEPFAESKSPELRPGDLVAARLGEVAASLHRAGTKLTETDGGLSIKRVAAGPGQTVEHRQGVLLVDGCPALGEATWIPVHDDSCRAAGLSRWQADVPVPETADGFRFSEPENEFSAEQDSAVWLIYHHRNVHHRLRPEAVGDDVPFNATESRQLFPVRRLRLTGVVRATAPTTLRLAFWDGLRTQQRFAVIPAGRSQLRVVGPLQQGSVACGEQASPAPADSAVDLPLLAHDRPAAIALPRGIGEISELRLWRPVEYRIDDVSAAEAGLPLRLRADEYFLLGDNEPLSIDSRVLGPIRRDRIAGRVSPHRG